MRITNKMMTNNMLYNINTNKNNMTALENKYASGLEIQKPSDDPIVAVRALKLRTNLSELTQYYKKNIPDAKSWMDTTESALKNTSEIITRIHTYCVQGANDTLTESERSSIADNLRELKNQAYAEGNSNYAGRYLFTGYKTDTPLLFEAQETNLEYTITEKFEVSDIEISSRIVDSLDVDNFDPANYEIPSSNKIYRIRLAYDKLKEGGDFELSPAAAVNTVQSDDPKAYKPGDLEINFIEDTGELILGPEVFKNWRTSDVKIEVKYQKDSFNKDELRPEHYFDCTCVNKDDLTAEPIIYKIADQRIEYEINFNQRLAINVQGRDAFRHSLGRTVDDVIKAISDVDNVKEKLARVEKNLKDTTLTQDEIDNNKLMQRLLNTELDLKDSLMREAYGRALTYMTTEENQVSAATSDIGTRYKRLELTEDRLSTQQVEFTDLLSQNEDADLVDTIVHYNAANTVYNASLQAAGKVVKNSLLDFL